MAKMRLKAGDKVAVISGVQRPVKGKYTEGKVIAVLPEKNKVIVEGINMVSKHTKPKNATTPGGIIKQEAPLDASKVMLVCPSCGKPARVGMKIMGDGSKVRVCKKCGEPIKK